MSILRKPVEIAVLKEVSDVDADYIASWMTEAFYKKDWGPWSNTGITYEQDPEAHRLVFRAVIDRGSVCGQILTTKDRSALRIQFRPGEKNKIFDLKWRSGKDEAWDKLAAKCGGFEAWEAHLKPFSKVTSAALRAAYGESEGVDFFRTMFLGIKPGCQGQGIGRAMQNHTIKEARERGVKFYHLTNMTNLPVYEHMGCRTIARDIDYGLPVLDGYPAGSERRAIVEAYWPA